MTGYLDDAEASSKVLVDGWLDTGDEGFMWRGELYLTGRAKDLIILRGRNHDPSVIEQSLAGISGLRSGCYAAFSVELDEGEGVAVLAEARGDVGDGIIDQMKQAIRGCTGIDPVAIEVLPAGSLPRTSSGKIRRGEARRLWLADGLAAPLRPGVLSLLAESFQGRRKLLMRRR
jgi:acyl-CoA synthetase (AMP-forming)/AMP-acid ligase II